MISQCTILTWDVQMTSWELCSCQKMGHWIAPNCTHPVKGRTPQHQPRPCYQRNGCSPIVRTNMQDQKWWPRFTLILIFQFLTLLVFHMHSVLNPNPSTASCQISSGILVYFCDGFETVKLNCKDKTVKYSAIPNK